MNNRDEYPFRVVDQHDQNPLREWLGLRFSKLVVRRAILYALVVGAILTAINHGDALVRADVNAAQWLKIGLKAPVPYTVSTLSSVSALRSLRSGNEP